MSLLSVRETFVRRVSALTQAAGNFCEGFHTSRRSRSRHHRTHLRAERLEQRLALSTTMAGLSNNSMALGPPVCSCVVLPPPPPTSYVIETSGSVTLTFDTTSSGGGYRANGQLITLNGQPFKGNTDWQAVAADVIDGVNTVVLRHWPGQIQPTSGFSVVPSSQGHLLFWRMDSEWRHVSGDGWIPLPPQPPLPQPGLIIFPSPPPTTATPQSTAFYATELAFGADLNLDRRVTTDAAGEVALSYSAAQNGTIGVKSPAMNSSRAITYNGESVSYSSLVAGGWTPVAAEVVDGVNTVVLRHTTGYLHFWRMDADWNQVGGDGWVAPGTSDFYSAEVTFGVDLDGDGGLTIENAGSVALDYAPDGNVRANGTPVVFNGSLMNYFSMAAAGWTPMAADVDNGINTVVLRHESGYLHFWRMDANWNQVGGDGWTRLTSRDFFAAEAAFGADLNGDGARTIEARGNSLLTFDRAGRLRVPNAMGLINLSTGEVSETFSGTSGAFIAYMGAPYNYVGGIKAGWRVMAAEVLDSQNTVLLKHIASGYLHFWRLDASWNQIGGDGWVAPGSPTYFAAEVSLGVDLDENGSIGG